MGDDREKEDKLRTRDCIGYFLSLVEIDIPSSDPLTWNYYLESFEPHYEAQTLWAAYVASLKKDFKSNWAVYRTHLAEVKTKVTTFIDNCTKRAEEWIKTKEFQFQPTDKLSRRHDAYLPVNDGRWFLSLDVKQANYQTFVFFMRHLVDAQSGEGNLDSSFPEVEEPPKISPKISPKIPETWEALLATFSSCKFLPLIKPLRQLWMGKTRWNKWFFKVVDQYFVEEISRVSARHLTPVLGPPLVVSHDEIIFALTGSKDKDKDRDKDRDKDEERKKAKCKHEKSGREGDSLPPPPTLKVSPKTEQDLSVKIKGKVKEVKEVELEEIRALAETALADLKWPQTWKIDLFQVHLLSRRWDYYSTESLSGKRRLKNVIKIHRPQIVNIDLGKELTEHDKAHRTGTNELAYLKDFTPM